MLDPIAAGVYFPAVTANHATAMENPLSHMPKANCALVYVPHEQFSGMPIGLKQASFMQASGQAAYCTNQADSERGGPYMAVHVSWWMG